MSTATVSSPKKRVSRPAAAKWDDEATKCLLQLIEGQIIAGHRPSGILSKHGWLNVVTSFNEKTGLNFNRDQLKNRQDNLRREFNKWEGLIGKETGLGWDPIRRTLTAPDEWWSEKAKIDPSIMKYKESGPTHLDLLQKVFGGVTATGYCAYIPELEQDSLLSPNDHLDQFEDTGPDDGTGLEQPTPVRTPCGPESDRNAQSDATPSATKLTARRKKRLSSVGNTSQANVIHSDMESMTQTIRDSIEVIGKRKQPEDIGPSYSESIDLLESIPGFEITNPNYWKAMRVLEDKVRRIAFRRAANYGVDAVLSWLATFPDIL